MINKVNMSFCEMSNWTPWFNLYWYHWLKTNHV